jgi:hypothetical protein
MPHVMLRSPPEVDDEVSKMVISQHFIRLRRIRFAQKDISHTLLGLYPEGKTPNSHSPWANAMWV